MIYNDKMAILTGKIGVLPTSFNESKSHDGTGSVEWDFVMLS